ncbi:3-hydroxyacyl-CoA dehydrogenase family protein [[Clostridium] polysaccharolyticum]|uniref:3-hydroxybutyryl-CoA dehydrogenase n=1 Tax=[Clostridium] polysaccharolyticum TaxID=29364 RepID=A0A1I0E441_9FIRM|nr:3-hydroxyacyl-CoA dehydrogenase family protein [[Clostridium] polysaccharolyticum]SET39875.1 3-hydroxybutyryl-CoA dehydrogenase [[Clostridium] polysaccharolyticum]
MTEIGVIGAGVMGCGITSAFMNNGYHVYLIEKDKEKYKDIEARIKQNNVLFRFNKKDIKPGKYEFVESIEELASCSFIIEAVSEKMDEKESVYKALSAIKNQEQIIISNTSCVPITKLGEIYGAAEKVVGIHFMNPVVLIDAVEVIRGKGTSEDTLEKVKALISDIKKEYFIVNDCAGFVSNRISHLYMNEAAHLFEEGIADARSIDGVFKKCYGHKSGPLETADIIGIDVVADSLDILYENYKQDKFKCAQILRKMVLEGKLGRKSGQGFYKY